MSPPSPPLRKPAEPTADQLERCLNCAGPKCEWQRFCGAACCVEYEMRKREMLPSSGDKT